MTFTKFVQIGRVVQINYGPDAGKLATIVDIVNDKRVLIDGPDSGVARQIIPLRRLVLTRFHIKEVLRSQRTVLLKKKIQKFDLQKKFDATNYAKRQAALKKRATLTDFDRFKVMVLRRRVRNRANLINHQGKVVAKQVQKATKGKGKK